MKIKIKIPTIEQFCSVFGACWIGYYNNWETAVGVYVILVGIHASIHKNK